MQTLTNKLLLKYLYELVGSMVCYCHNCRNEAHIANFVKDRKSVYAALTCIRCVTYGGFVYVGSVSELVAKANALQRERGSDREILG
jgi:hypothetical protein